MEAIVNQFVLEDLPIKTEILSKDEAMAKGAMALFTEKYGDEVRVVTMGDGVSVELCGGTHCTSTGQIGLVKIVSEASVSAGLRRIEAIAGTQINRALSASSYTWSLGLQKKLSVLQKRLRNVLVLFNLRLRSRKTS